MEMETWKHGHEKWKHGNIEMIHGNMEKYKHRHGDIET
jgi:hypothetical protein